MFKKGIKKVLAWLTVITVCASHGMSGISIVNAQEPTPIMAVDFEDGKLEGWGNRGGASISIVADPTNASEKSLYVEGRTQNWESAQYDISQPIQPGIEYSYSVDVYHTSTTPQSIKLTNQVKESDGTDGYKEIITPQDIPANEWKTLEGRNTIVPGSTPVVFYPEAVDAELDFYIDNFKIIQMTSELPPQEPGENTWEGVEEDFEEGEANGWVAREGTEIVEVVNNVARSGSNSLKVSNRKISYEGVKYPFTEDASNGTTYEIKVWVYQDTGSDETINLTMEPHRNGNPSYEFITGAVVASGEWTEIVGEYSLSYAGELTDISLYLESPNEKLEFYLDDFSMKPETVAAPDIDLTLASLYKAYEDIFTIGVALPAGSLSNPTESDLALHHFNTLTAENDMKPEGYMDQAASEEAGELVLDFSKSDVYYNYAKDNKIPLRGHTLVWHSQTPDWFFKEGFEEDGALENRETMLARMDNHIKQVTMHYIEMDQEAGLTSPTIYAWDVVNEAIEIGDGKANGMRDSLWTQTVGDDFVEKAFEYTRNYTQGQYSDGKVELYYNDYNTEDAARRDAMFKMVEPIVDKGWIDGIGLQSHINMTSPSVENLEKTIQMIGDLELEAHITELDITVYFNNHDSYDEFPKELEIQQAYRYKSLFDMFEANKETLTNVTFWGLRDNASWLNGSPVTRNNWPLLFDKNLQPKLAYWALVDASKLPLMGQTAHAYAGAIEVDGKEDLTWKLQAATPISKTSDLASFKTAWKDNTLYAWVEVMDEDINQEDGIIIYGDKKIRILRNGQVDTDGVLAKVKEIDKGYVVEVAIPLEENLVEGNSVGFDLGLINGDTVTRWNDMSQSEAANPEAYGNLILKSAIKATEAVKGTPEIGADIDSIWDTANEITTDIYTQNTKGAKAKVKTLWDEDYLYVLAKVADSNLSDQNANEWEQDSIEVFIDENLHRTDYYQEDDVQYRINFKNLVTINGGSNGSKFKSVAKVIDGGYYIEMSIPHNIAPFKAGQIMGFDVQVNDDHGSGQRDSMSNWYDDIGAGYQNTQNFGTVILVDVEKPGPSKPEPSKPGTSGGSSSSSSSSSSKTDKEEIVKDTVEDAIENMTDKNVNINVTQKEGSNKIEAKLPIKGLFKDRTKDINKVVLKGRDMTISLDSDLLELEKANEDDELIVIAEMKEGTNPTIELTLKIGERFISQVSKPINVRADYNVSNTAKQYNLVVKYLDKDSGEAKVIKDSFYDAKTGEMVFTTKNLGEFVIEEVEVEFKDVSNSHWANETISYLAAREIISGVAYQEYAPKKVIDRAEFITMVMNAYDLTVEGLSSDFTDVDQDMWYTQAIATAEQMNITSGKGAGEFGLNDQITREEMIVLIYRALDSMKAIEKVSADHIVAFSDSDQISDYAKEAIEQLSASNVVNGIGNNKIGPKETATRADAAAIIYKALTR